MDTEVATWVARCKDIVEQFILGKHLHRTDIEEFQSLSLVGVTTCTIGTFLEHYLKD